MNGLDLFTGVGTFTLALRNIIPGYRTICYVEIEPFCQANIIARIADGYLDDAPIWDDIRTFDGRPLKGFVDIITGGDPCQEDSNARQGTETRQPSLGAEFIRIVKEIRPRFVLRENPSVVRKDAPWSSKRFADSLGKLGYIAGRIKINACCCGADHRRSRMFVFAALPNPRESRFQRDELKKLAYETGRGCLCNTTGQNWRLPTPRVCRGFDGVANRMDRLKAIGNGIVPQVVKRILEVR